MSRNVGWSSTTPPAPIRASMVTRDQVNVEIDGDQVVISALGVERLRMPRTDIPTLTRLLEARAE